MPGTNPHFSGSSRDSERGAALVVAVTAIVTVVITAGTLLQATVSHQKEIDRRIQRDRSRHVASSGAHQCVAMLGLDPTLRGSQAIDVGQGRAQVELTSLEADGVDNDGDGLVDEADEEHWFLLRSNGWSNAPPDGMDEAQALAGYRFRSRTEVSLWWRRADANIQTALYVDDPYADIDVRGAAFRVSGQDSDPLGLLDPSESLQADNYAMTVPGDTSWIVSQIDTTQLEDFVGQGDPSIGTGTSLDLPGLVETVEPYATTRYDVATKLTDETIGDADAGVMEVCYAASDLSIAGNLSGFGILVVEGNLEVHGSVEFNGLIIVGGGVFIGGGGSTKMINGALLCLGAVDSEAVTLGGSVDIMYSSSIVEAAIDRVSGLQVVGWLDR